MVGLAFIVKFTFTVTVPDFVFFDDFDFVELVAVVQLSVAENDPALDGRPERSPERLSDIPDGRLPEVLVQVPAGVIW